MKKKITWFLSICFMATLLFQPNTISADTSPYNDSEHHYDVAAEYRRINGEKWSAMVYEMKDSMATYEVHLSKDKKEAWISKITKDAAEKVPEFKVPGKYKNIPVTKIGCYYTPDIEDCDVNLFGSYVEIFHESAGYTPEMDGVKKIILPNTLKEIVGVSFSGLDMETINIPSGVKEIQAAMFYGCSKLKNLNFANGTYKITKNVFLDCYQLNDALTSLKNEKIYVKDGMIFTGDKKSCLWVPLKTKNVKIPSGVKTICGDIFRNSCVKTVSIPSSVTEIEMNAFTTNHAIRFQIAKGNKHYKVSGGNVYSKISERLVVGVPKKGVLTIPSEVKVLKENSSLAGKEVKKLIMPKGKIRLGKNWFDNGTYGGAGTKIYFKTAPPKRGEGTLPLSAKIYVPKKYYSQYKKWLQQDKEEAKFCKLYKIA